MHKTETRGGMSKEEGRTKLILLYLTFELDVDPAVPQPVPRQDLPEIKVTGRLHLVEVLHHLSRRAERQAVIRVRLLYSATSITKHNNRHHHSCPHFHITPPRHDEHHHVCHATIIHAPVVTCRKKKYIGKKIT